LSVIAGFALVGGLRLAVIGRFIALADVAIAALGGAITRAAAAGAGIACIADGAEEAVVARLSLVHRLRLALLRRLVAHTAPAGAVQ
jgi:hypothetical protein